MKALWGFVTSSEYYPPGSTSRSGGLTPGGIIFFVILLNALAVYTLETGNMIGRRAPTIVDGRHNMPTLYWIYAGFMIFGSITFDIILLLAWKAFAAKKTENEI
jgi:hypothetical protein